MHWPSKCYFGGVTRRDQSRKLVVGISLLLALGTGVTSGCAGTLDLKGLGDDRLSDGFGQVLLWRIRFVDHTGSLGGIPRFWFAVHKPGRDLVAEMPNPDTWTSRTFEDGNRLYEAAYTMQSRAGRMELETGTYAARGTGGGRGARSLLGDTVLRLTFAPPIALEPHPGESTHLGILRIEINEITDKGEVTFTQTIEHDRVLEQADREAFRSRYPAVASQLHAN